jgi:hypothetical protein
VGGVELTASLAAAEAHATEVFEHGTYGFLA